jgi:type I restriction enzyme R subunit
MGTLAPVSELDLTLVGSGLTTTGLARIEADLDDFLLPYLIDFNEQFGTSFSVQDRIRRLIREEIAPQVAQGQRYRNARANTPNSAEIELDAALNRVVDPLLLDQTEFYKQFKDNALFHNFVRELVKRLIGENPGESP